MRLFTGVKNANDDHHLEVAKKRIAGWYLFIRLNLDVVKQFMWSNFSFQRKKRVFRNSDLQELRSVPAQSFSSDFLRSFGI